MHCPDATAIAGYHRWPELGRQVRKGEHGIPIYAPMIVGGDKDERNALRQAGESLQATSAEDRQLRRGRGSYSGPCRCSMLQTDGEPLPEAA
jgi:hypothetical protein